MGQGSREEQDIKIGRGDKIFNLWKSQNNFIIFFYPLTAMVIEAPQMISQPVSSIFPYYSTALWDLVNSGPVHPLMMSSHLFLYLPCLLPPFTAPCTDEMARPDEWDTWPYHCSLHLFTMIRWSSCGLIACWILAHTSSLVTWSLYQMHNILQ